MKSKSNAPPQVWIKKGNALHPVSDSAISSLDSIKNDSKVSVKITRPRNLLHHQKYWVLMKIVSDNSDDLNSPEAVHFAVRAALSRGQWFKPKNAVKPLFIPESISFASMSQDEFSDFYSEAIDIVIKYFLKGMDRDAIEEIISKF